MQLLQKIKSFGDGLFMKKANSRVYRSIKLMPLLYSFLIFLFINGGESMTYARGAHLFLAFSTPEPTSQSTAKPTAQPTVKPTAQPTVEPTVQPTVKPTTQPTVKPTAKPTVKSATEPMVKPTVKPMVKPTPVAERMAVQPRQTTSNQQSFPIDLPHIPSASVTSVTPIPTSSLETGTPPIVASLSDRTTVLSALPLSDVQQDNTPLKLLLILGVMAPLLLIIAGTFWLLMKWLIKRTGKLTHCSRQHFSSNLPKSS